MSIQKRTCVLVCSVWTLLFLLNISIFSGPALADNRIVKIGVYENAPKVFTSPSGKPSGIFIDIIEYIANEEDWQLEYVKGTWAEGLDRLEAGKIDLMPDVAFTAERERKFSFHKITALSSWSQVYAPKGSKIQSILDLNKKRIAVLEGSVQQSTFKQFSRGFDLDITIVPVPTFEAVFEAVVKGEANAAITNRFYGLMHANDFGLEDTAVVFEPATLFFAAKKGADEQLLITIDKHLLNLKKILNLFITCRPALGLDKALEEIIQNRGVLYDPETVDACLNLFKEKEYKLI